jgi:hypothetical protein
MSELAEEIQADALESQRFSRKHLVLELDFSARSIDELEGEIDTVEYAISGGKSDENIAMFTRIWGAYLGESIRKNGGGEWIRDDEGQIGLRNNDVVLQPHHQIRRRLLEGAELNLSRYYQESIKKL